jgi:hypothetical protein
MGVQVGKAGGAEASAPGLGLQRLEAVPLAEHAPRYLVEAQPGALAARHRAPATRRLGDRGPSITHANMIMKRVFKIKPAATAGATLEWPMPEALDVGCPCCGSLLKVDPETGTVVWAEKKKAKPKDLDDLVQRVEAQKSVLDQKFARSVQQTQHAGEILEKKFEEARRRAERDKDKKAPHPFDNE